MRKILNLSATVEEKLKAQWGLWIVSAIVLLIMVAVVKGLFPSAIPYGVFDLWSTSGNPIEWMVASWPILIWATGLTFLVSALTRNKRHENHNAEEYLAKGLWVSLRAGVMEEIVFRWLMFMLAIVSAKVGDWILGGFIFEHGLVWVMNSYILLPIANFFTLGLLEEVLMNGSAWYIATAVLVANSKFRDGHKYQGPFGFINSWFIGMYFFYLMFEFGLVAAIFVHFVYDAFIFGIRYVDRVHERSRDVSED